jgi:hypothetical protein
MRGYVLTGLSKLAFCTLPRWRAVYPTQAKKRLEWGTQPLLLVQGVGVRAVCVTTSHFLPTGYKSWVPHSSRFLA